jgi:hypothetical protein
VFSGLDVEEEADELFGVSQSVVLHELTVRGEGGGDHKTLDITLIIVFNTELNLLFPIKRLVLGASGNLCRSKILRARKVMFFLSR